MRNHDTLTKALIVLSSFFVLSCQHVELPETQQHKIVASVGAYNTKANFHMTETPNVLCEWNGRETLRVYYKRSNGKYHSTFANAPVARVEEEGKSADFTFSPEQAWGFNGNVSSYPVAIFTVNCFPTIDPEDGSIYLDARLVRQPLKDFELPVYYVGEVVNGTVEATFSHYYAYEFLHVKNTSDKTIEFSLNGYETPWIWYKKLASVGLEDGVVYNKSWSGLTPAEVSYPVSIAPGSSDIIVSAYIPNDFIIKDASIVATIDGNVVKSSNKKSSAAPLVPGRAYHMYATWDGNELKFGNANELPDELGIGFTHLELAENAGYGFTTGREGHLRLESSDPSVATAIETDDVGDLHVDIRSHSIGTAIITITDTDTGQKSQIEVVVRETNEYNIAVREGNTKSVQMKKADGQYEAYSDNTSIATCEVSGSIIYVSGKKTGETTIHVTELGTGKQFLINVLVYYDGALQNVPEAVDLGLPSGLKWASFNLGASKPEEYGDYYAWGETEPYYSSLDPLTWKDGKDAGYAWSSYKWCMGSDKTLTKYCNFSSYGFNGFTDNKTVLDLEDDAAHMNLGGTWRMPTDAEWTELREKCTWTLTTQNGVRGRLVTGSNGNSIFLPAASDRRDADLYGVGSYGYYWSSSLGTAYPSGAWGVSFYSGGVDRYDDYRYFGFSVRPVNDDSSKMPEIEVSPTDIEFGAVPYGTSSTKYVTVKNIGSGVLSFTVENVSAPFSVTPTSYSLSAGESVQLAFTYTPVSATSGAGGRCTIVSNATQSVVSVTYSGSGTESGGSTPEAVDLGLPSGLKWASFNLGASKPEEYGDYYAWGETEPYYSSLDPLTWKDGKDAGYAWSSYKWCMGSDKTLTKYCNFSSYGFNGFTDNKTVLDLEDDAAHMNLGGTWRMPTDAEWTELREKCTWTWTTQNGVDGRLVTASNGNGIFLPAAGYRRDADLYGVGSYGHYWSSSLYTGNPSRAWYVDFYSRNVYGSYSSRYIGFSVRPVYAE